MLFLDLPLNFATPQFHPLTESSTSSKSMEKCFFTNADNWSKSLIEICHNTIALNEVKRSLTK